MTKPMTALRQRTIDLLNQRGVQLTDIAALVIFLQKDYIADLTPADALESVQTVLHKREVQNAVITGIQLDIAAEQHSLLEPLQTIVERDEGLYGVDETMALSIVDIYGSIGFTNYGYIDRVKPGILAKLNAHEPGIIHTFLDDLVGAIAAAAAARLAHDDAGEEDTPFK
ncbi:MAG: phosphatidylglycerophosphatase A [Levilactobacillus sp.]|jgi:phosphatidylglycerophosphatase A|uniref:Phosphatidylglycerophosphatase A n=1 Tax=Levilactobacillus suantsaiihabitans TaxID=2487722 RepID=A0A4Z0JB36_9LACO|nr:MULTISPECIES: phosphatidylglycerophosphatase A [Levilactobacillus]MCH4124394.1 phosphatidylglycerophosphatase A [Levilactobacillus sp.]MCI1554588.1 phosphatidylglycerophosphatase A [Levilactobacillus sp.]MCI1599731.1 phosphatidylglycerophosphatase A [Levilactobacillus sp.]TGD19312.1 phosphatidylglycerophosphatase A [Levilactobacillus suantsaiihabitans]